MKKILIIYIYLLFSYLFASSLEFYENSYAVIIGINNYTSDNVKNLGYAVEDAESIANLLITKLGYKEENVHVLLNEDATQANIKNKLYQIAMEADKNDRILVFYGGHGETIPLPSGGELGYLLPVDGDPANLFASGLSMQEFKQISEITSAKHVLYLVDVCYGGIMTIETRSLEKNDFNDDEKYLKKITTESARQIITAGGKGDKAQERSIWGHSAFTKELLSGIEEGLADMDQDGFITSNELGIYLSKRVYIISEENQTPINGRYGSGEGEFVFVNPAYIEKIVEEKVENKISSSQTNIFDNSQIERNYSEIQHTLNLLVNKNDVSNNNISFFENDDVYLDSSFVGPWIKVQLEKNMSPGDQQKTFQSNSRKYIQQYYDLYNFRLSSYLIPIGPTFNHTRVTGLIAGPIFEITQLQPRTLKIDYAPTYSFSLKQIHQHFRLIRHPWSKKNQYFSIEYFDEVATNDNWLRDKGFNLLSSMFYGKDYRDYFNKKGFQINHFNKFNENISMIVGYSNTYQSDVTSIKAYKNSLFKKKNIINRNNFHTVPNAFKEGKHINVHTKLTLNNLKKQLRKKFSFTLELIDSTGHLLDKPAPKVFLIPESKGWARERYEMHRPINGDEINVHKFADGIIEVSIDSELKDSTNSVSTDSLYKIQYFYEVTIRLPHGAHAYRYLIDSTRYDIDSENETQVINSGDIVKTVGVITIERPYRFDIGYEYADKTLGSDFSYERISFNYSIIRSLSTTDALSFRLMGGFSKKHLPVQKLFYIGGEGSVRGFDYMDTKKYSGNQILMANMEYHFSGVPFFDDPFLFYDIGYIGNKFYFNQPTISYGLGIGSNILTLELENLEYDDYYSIILYKTKDSNEGKWGIEFMYKYFFDQFDAEVDEIEYILP